jgi:LmbE family N-acetylglucosaminyl deacetylase
MKTIVSTKDLGIDQNSKILVFMPHPDDEAVFVSGLLKKLSLNKIKTKVITFTRGEKSTLRYGLTPNENLADVRQSELTKSFKVLGVTDFQILSFPDGGLKTKTTEIKNLVADEIKKFKPTCVVALEPDGIYGHPDHIILTHIVGSVVKPPLQLLYTTIAKYLVKPEAAKMAEKENITPIAPQFCLKLGIRAKIAKIRALRAHHSQFNVIKTDYSDSDFFKANHLLDQEYYTYR